MSNIPSAILPDLHVEANGTQLAFLFERTWCESVGFLWPLVLFDAGSTVCAFGINDLAASELALELAEKDERPVFSRVR
jgi:hypothetical protein